MFFDVVGAGAGAGTAFVIITYAVYFYVSVPGVGAYHHLITQTVNASRKNSGVVSSKRRPSWGST